MKSNGDDASSSTSLEHRRWLIGIGITVMFGIFGMVMALLNYSGGGKPAVAPTPAAAAPDRAASPTTHGHGKDGKDGKNR